MVKLDVPLVCQKEGTNDCGVAGVVMLMKFYGLNISMEEVKKDIEVDETGTYIPQLGAYLLERGFDVEIVGLHPAMFTKKDEGMSQEKVLERFRFLLDQSKNEKNRKVLKFFVQFMEKGGIVNVKIPSEEDLRDELEEGRPVGVLLTSNFLLGDKPNFNFHFNVVKGVDGEYVYVNDPLPSKEGGEQKYGIKNFMYGVYASLHGDLDNACFMKVRKR